MNCIEDTCGCTRPTGYGEKFGHASGGQRQQRRRHIPAFVSSAALRKKAHFLKFHSEILPPHILVEKIMDFAQKRHHHHNQKPHPLPPVQRWDETAARKVNIEPGVGGRGARRFKNPSAIDLCRDLRPEIHGNSSIMRKIQKIEETNIEPGVGGRGRDGATVRVYL